MSRLNFFTFISAILILFPGCNSFQSSYQEVSPAEIYESILSESPDMEADDLLERLYSPPSYLEKLSFDPEKLPYFRQVSASFPMSDKALAKLRKNGFVSLQKHNRESFGTAYYHIYTNDLPLFISTDSILQAVHVSFDEILKEMEDTVFTTIFEEIISECRKELALYHKSSSEDEKIYCSDLDIYLTVAINLLYGAGSSNIRNEPAGREDSWNGRLVADSLFGNNDKVLEILKKISNNVMEVPGPGNGNTTLIYGGKRPIDYSQFIPRGHYVDTTALKRYFRMMMWLGRMDCGFNVLPSKTPFVYNDSKRECRDSVLLVYLLMQTDNLSRLKQIGNIIDLMIGRDDSLTPLRLSEIISDNQFPLKEILRDREMLEKLQIEIRKSPYSKQAIQSQVVGSDPMGHKQTDPPAALQFFGQRFTIDSFIMGKTAFDSIIYKKQKQLRYKPKGLDVMGPLGNMEAVKLLEPDLKEFNYASNFFALKSMVDKLPADFWKENIYNMWLHALRDLDKNVCNTKNVPESMKTKAWQMKQLQTQHASWSQLRHDTLLYVKQPYGDSTLCEYPVAYVEPYPDFFGHLADYSKRAEKLFRNAEYLVRSREKFKDWYDKEYTMQEKLIKIKKSQVAYMQDFGKIMQRLESMSRKELEGKPFSEEEEDFFRRTIDRQDESGGPRYDGWYCDLFYYRGWKKGTRRWEHTRGGALAYKWDPEIADVYSYPDQKLVLEVGTGNVEFMVIAVDNDGYRNIYVGPVFSYYEFWQPASSRLNDDQWQNILSGKDVPKRPAWTDCFVDKISKTPISVKDFDFPEKITSANFNQYRYLFSVSYDSPLQAVSSKFVDDVNSGVIKVEFDDKLYSEIRKIIFGEKLDFNIINLIYLNPNDKSFAIVLDCLKREKHIDTELIAKAFKDDKYLKQIREEFRKSTTTDDINDGFISLLGEYKDRESVPELIKLLESEDGENINSAIYSLGNIGDKRAIASIKKFVDNNNYSYVATPVLCKLGDRNTIELMKKRLLLEESPTNGKKSKYDNHYDAKQAVNGLSAMENKEAFQFLSGLLKKEKFKYKYLVYKAFSDWYKNPDVIQLLSERLKKGKDINCCIYVLKDIAGSDTIPIIFENLPSSPDINFDGEPDIFWELSYRIGPEHFIEGLESENRNIRMLSINVLKEYREDENPLPPELYNKLFKMLASDYRDKGITEAIIDRLTYYKEKDLVKKVKLDIIKKAGFNARGKIIYPLRLLDAKEAAPVLAEWLDDSDPKVVVEIIGLLKDWSYLPAKKKIVELLESENENIQRSALYYVKTHRVKEAFPVVLRVAEKKWKNGKDYYDLWGALFHLDRNKSQPLLIKAGLKGNSSALEHLAEYCDKSGMKPFLMKYQSEGDMMKGLIAPILGHFNDPEVVKTLYKSAKSKRDVRFPALFALAKLGHEKDVKKEILDYIRSVPSQRKLDKTMFFPAVSAVLNYPSSQEVRDTILKLFDKDFQPRERSYRDVDSYVKLELVECLQKSNSDDSKIILKEITEKQTLSGRIREFARKNDD